MKNVYFNNNKEELVGSEIKEGGLSRNINLANWFRSNILDFVEVKTSRNSYLNYLNLLLNIINPLNKSIIIQYPSFGFNLYSNKSINKLLYQLLFLALNIASKHKNVIVDVSDLKYEQSRDLEINSSIISNIRYFESLFFKLDLNFVFASKSMQRYAIKKYNVKTSDVCNNGSIRLILDDNQTRISRNSKMKFVYAGSLNKGRQIEEMINSFPESDNIELIVLGQEGEWLRDYVKQENIHYLGSLTEIEAYNIVSKCHVGLIPYDESKLYYNIAYPTKLSFYLAAGITFLSTPVSEVIFVNESYEIGFTSKLSSWTKIFNEISIEKIESDIRKISLISHMFTWDYILNETVTYKRLK